jgi:hypothetical protein
LCWAGPFIFARWLFQRKHRVADDDSIVIQVVHDLLKVADVCLDRSLHKVGEVAILMKAAQNSKLSGSGGSLRARDAGCCQRLGTDHDSEIGRTEEISQLASLWVLGVLHHERGIRFRDKRHTTGAAYAFPPA